MSLLIILQNCVLDVLIFVGRFVFLEYFLELRLMDVTASNWSTVSVRQTISLDGTFADLQFPSARFPQVTHVLIQLGAFRGHEEKVLSEDVQARLSLHRG